MHDTLTNASDDFVKKNNGMTLISTDVQNHATSCTINFGDGEGVCNGGHTYFAIVTSPAGVGDDALVHLEVIQLPSGLTGEDKKQEITRIARARNSNNRLLLRSEADFLDYYETIKESLDNPAFVSWHEGDSTAVADAVKADDFIRILTAMDPLKFYHPAYGPTAKSHKQAVTAGKSVNFQWFEATEEWKDSGQQGLAPLAHVAPLSNDIFRLRDSIAETFADTIPISHFRTSRLYQDQIKDNPRNSLTDPSSTGFAPPITVEIMLLGLFRTDVWLHFDALGDPDLVGWVIDPLRLWGLPEVRAHVLDGLGAAYGDAENDPINFIRTDAPYRADFYHPGVGQPFPNNPEVIYQISTGDRYNRLNSSTNSTHYLVPGTPDALHGASGNAPSTAVFYREV